MGRTGGGYVSIVSDGKPSVHISPIAPECILAVFSSLSVELICILATCLAIVVFGPSSDNAAIIFLSVGILCTLATTCLAIVVYGPSFENARGVAEVSALDPVIPERAVLGPGFQVKSLQHFQVVPRGPGGRKRDRERDCLCKP